MTIPAAQSSISAHTGNGVADTFDYEFKITNEDELLVSTRDADDVVTVLALSTDYTVSGVGDNSGGSITLVAGALASGVQITIEDNVQASQLTPFENQSAFFGSLHEAAFDKLTRLAKRLTDLVGKAIRIPSTVTGVNTVLPTPVALNLIRWDETATNIEQVDPSALTTLAAAAAWTVDTFVVTTDYTPDVTTELTLSADPGTIRNTWVLFDGATQQQSEYTVAGTTITFDSAIPSGVDQIEIRQVQALENIDVNPWADRQIFAAGTRHNNDDSNHMDIDYASGTVTFDMTGTADQILFANDGTTAFTFETSTGEFTATGDVTAFSDINLKKNLEPIDFALEKIGHLSGFSYDRKDLKIKQDGIIAQDLLDVLPNSVKATDEGLLKVNYNGVVALLVNAVKELHEKVESLEGKG